MESEAFHRAITNALRTACTNGELDWSILAEWEQQWETCQRKLPLLEQEIRDLRQALLKSLEPPLSYAIFLDHSPGDERDVIVGSGSSRLEVRLTEDVEEQQAALYPGQQLVLNKEQNVVALRGDYTGGETAEVVNILKPESAADVLEVVRGTPQNPLRLRVRWRDGEDLEVDCSADLCRQPLKRGDVVAIDPDRMQATARVRPRLHVRAGGTEGIVVDISDQLFEVGVQIGDIVRVETGLRFAFEKLPAYETGGLTLEDIPDVGYEDIGGLEGQIEQVYDAIELPYLFRAQFEQYQLSRPKGLLLYGPPGCGKTMIAKAVANNLTRTIREHLSNLEKRIVLYRDWQARPDDLDLLTRYHALAPPRQDPLAAGHVPDPLSSNGTAEAARAHLAHYLSHHRVDLDDLDGELRRIRAVLSARDGIRGFFLNVKGPELLDKYVGETEHRIRKIFEEARRHASFYTPVVIFFDEMEAMFRARGSGRSSDVETTIVPQFLSELDGVEASENLIIIGASNRADLIDPAIMRPGRLDIKIKVDRPTREAALDIFALYLLPTLPLDYPDPARSTGDDGAARADASDAASTAGLGRIVFRTAYRLPDGDQHRLAPLGHWLPEGCDCRLAHAIQTDDRDRLAAYPASTTVREALADLGDDPLAKRLRRFKPTTTTGHIVEQLRGLADALAADEALAALLAEQMRVEWRAEAMIYEIVGLLYSPASLMNVLTNAGNRYTFYLRDFVSGAVIANIIARAKKSAVKRAVLGVPGASQGISLDDLHTAARAEFDESRDQLAQDKLNSDLERAERVKFAELVLESGAVDPWDEPKLRPYVTFA